MSKEWITELAKDIQRKGHETAETYGRSQHESEIIATKGRSFYSAFIIALEDNVNEIKRQLQGDVTSSDTTFQAAPPTEVKLTRSRFPWFDAHITHKDSTLILDYAQGRGVPGDPELGREVRHFDFRVTYEDILYVEESFREDPRRFQQPEDLARHVVELLFAM